MMMVPENAAAVVEVLIVDVSSYPVVRWMRIVVAPRFVTCYVTSDLCRIDDVRSVPGDDVRRWGRSGMYVLVLRCEMGS